jgi:hypothetical protein
MKSRLTSTKRTKLQVFIKVIFLTFDFKKNSILEYFKLQYFFHKYVNNTGVFVVLDAHFFNLKKNQFNVKSIKILLSKAILTEVDRIFQYLNDLALKLCI